MAYAAGRKQMKPCGRQTLLGVENDVVGRGGFLLDIWQWRCSTRYLGHPRHAALLRWL